MLNRSFCRADEDLHAVALGDQIEYADDLLAGFPAQRTVWRTRSRSSSALMFESRCP